MNTRIINCTCQHKDQDKWYGVGKRVANKTMKSASTNHFYFRCTVCGKESTTLKPVK